MLNMYFYIYIFSYVAYKDRKPKLVYFRVFNIRLYNIILADILTLNINYYYYY